MQTIQAGSKIILQMSTNEKPFLHDVKPSRAINANIVTEQNETN